MKLLTQQPALLELTPTTVKARLESLAALFQVGEHDHNGMTYTDMQISKNDTVFRFRLTRGT